ncbi:hypothetical protein CEXT_509631 [Caerostris extrusa]|uniref:Secreted protein n=1 Tax=Caerostris extrusa TaxID=172846 RepID=A0AAV4PV91_CAEEX|nr:hypothetical protein CEXT_509631 [Caerostris extrusa]
MKHVGELCWSIVLLNAALLCHIHAANQSPVFCSLQLQPVVDRECAWKHSPIVERMSSKGALAEGRVTLSETALRRRDVEFKQGAGLTGMLTSTSRPKWMKVCLDECV